MKIIPALSLALLISGPSNLVSAQSPGLPSIRMSCLNPNLKVKFTSIQHSQASTEPVQFNVNIPAGKGTVFVDEKNHGICTAKISEGFQFTGGSGQMDPRQISVSDLHTNADLMQNIRVIPRIQGNQTMMFEVVSEDPAIKGNLNIAFIARYKAD